MKNTHNLQSLFIHKALIYDTTKQSIFSTSDISKHAILISIPKSQTINFRTIPQQFRASLICKLKNIQKKKKKICLDMQEIVLTIYLMHLKAYSKIAVRNQDWFDRQSHGFVLFEQQSIRASRNQDLIIQYFAYRNYLKQIAKLVYIELLYEHPETKNTTNITSSLDDLTNFQKQFIWATEFKNSRSFGYTSDTTLIPFMDFINHSSCKRKNNSELIITEIKSTLEKKQNSCIQEELAIFHSEKDRQCKENQSDNDSEQQQTGHISGLHGQKSHIQEDSLFFYMVSNQTINEGDQLHLNYGRRTNLYLLKWYGFVQRDNCYDSFLLYFCPYSENIYFNSLERTAIKIKLKVNKFSIQLLIQAKKQYFHEFYQKGPGKIFWTLPNDLKFQLFFVQKVINRMSKQLPTQNKYDLKYKGSQWLIIFEQQQQKIYKKQIEYWTILMNQTKNRLFKKQKEANEVKMDLQWIPENLKDYLSNINKL